jgi:ParB family transcriptional regulator, chromosome partitioning protein
MAEGQSATPDGEPGAATTPKWEFAWIDPELVDIGPNVRTVVDLDPRFVESVRAHGVLTPISVFPGEAGRYRLRYGQRRTLAALETERPVIPAIIVLEVPDDETAREIERISDQFHENVHRTPLTLPDEARAALALFEIVGSPKKVAKALSLPAAKVKRLLVVAQSEQALQLAAQYPLDLEQSATVADFADDEEAVETLMAAAAKGPQEFTHAEQVLRDRRKDAQLRQALVDRLHAEGIEVIKQPYDSSGPIRILSRLRATPDAEAVPLTVERHGACPGHAAYISTMGFTRATKASDLNVVHVCTDFRANGHAELYAPAGVPTTSQVKRPWTEEEKTTRKEVIANNRDMESAQAPRRKWVREFLQSAKVPADAQAWITLVLARYGLTLDHDNAVVLLGLKDKVKPVFRGAGEAIVDATRNASPARITMLQLAMLFGAFEGLVNRETWRYPKAETCEYYRQLEAWGYVRAPVERLVVMPTKNAKPTEVDPDDVVDPEAPTAPDDTAQPDEEADAQAPTEEEEEES